MLAGIRFTQDNYKMVDSEGGGEVERKRIYTNPDPTVEMTGDALFNVPDTDGYNYLSFIVTSTDGATEIEEICELAPLKQLSGQFIISMPGADALYGRKVYRTAGVVKPSVSVYNLGQTTGDRNYCIIKSIDALKI